MNSVGGPVSGKQPVREDREAQMEILKNVKIFLTDKIKK